MGTTARWLSWLKRLTSNEEIPSSNLGRAFLTIWASKTSEFSEKCARDKCLSTNYRTKKN